MSKNTESVTVGLIFHFGGENSSDATGGCISPLAHEPFPSPFGTLCLFAPALGRRHGCFFPTLFVGWMARSASHTLLVSLPFAFYRGALRAFPKILAINYAVAGEGSAGARGGAQRGGGRERK